MSKQLSKQFRNWTARGHDMTWYWTSLNVLSPSPRQISIPDCSRGKLSSCIVVETRFYRKESSHYEGNLKADGSVYALCPLHHVWRHFECIHETDNRRNRSWSFFLFVRWTLFTDVFTVDRKLTWIKPVWHFAGFLCGQWSKCISLLMNRIVITW